MPRKNLILHCGLHKTGTSTLQALFREASDSGLDIHYPQAGRGQGLQHNNLVWQITNQKRFNAKIGGWEALREEISETQASNILISAEAMEGVPPETVKTMLDQTIAGLDCDARVVIYVRPHASRILSSYTQKLKTGQLTDTLADFVLKTLHSGEFQFADAMANWRDAFADTVHLRPFVRSHLVDGDIVADFTETFFPDLKQQMLDLKKGMKQLNVTPNVKVLTVLKMATEIFRLDKNPGRARLFEAKVLSTLRGRLETLYGDVDEVLRLASSDVEIVRNMRLADAEALDELMQTGGLFVEELQKAKGDDAANLKLSPEVQFSAREAAIHETYLRAIGGIMKRVDQ